MNRTNNKNNSSLAGEFAVLSMLHLYGFEASMSLGNTKSFDLFVFDSTSDKSYRVEVKTTISKEPYSSTSFWGNHWAWLISDRMKEANALEKYKDIIFCFVHFSDENDQAPCHPYIYVVPSKKVVEYVRKAAEIANANNKTEKAYMRIGNDTSSDKHLFGPDYLNAFEKYFKK